jgi:MerR family redox-sensitive transcriptional activator SoxR
MLAKTSKGRNDLVPIGVVAQRTGLAVSAIRYYEERGLIASVRTGGNQRRFLRSDIRRLSFVLIAQRLGLGLSEIERELASLPKGRTPTVLDWQRISRSLRGEIDGRIQLLIRTRNKEDRAGAAGPGPRYVLD